MSAAAGEQRTSFPHLLQSFPLNCLQGEETWQHDKTVHLCLEPSKPCKPGRLLGQSKTAPSKQETRSRSRRSNKASPVRTTLWSTVLQCYQAGPRLRRPAQYVDKVGTARACRVRCIKHRGGSQEPLAGTRQLASTSTFLGTSGGLQLPSL